MVVHRNVGVTIDGMDVEFLLETQGEPERHVELVHMHAQNAAVQAMQALRDGKRPEACDGMGYSVNWDGVLAGETKAPTPEREGDDAE